VWRASRRPVDLGELVPVEVVEVGARPVRVGNGAESTGSSGDLVEVTLDRLALGFDSSEGGFGVVDGAPGVGEAVSRARPAADAGVTFVVRGGPHGGLQALAELLVDLGDLGGVGRPEEAQNAARSGAVPHLRGQSRATNPSQAVWGRSALAGELGERMIGSMYGRGETGRALGD
jgi:hypothetical protein